MGGRDELAQPVAERPARATVLDISPGQNLSAGTPKLLFEFAAAVSRMVRIYDIAPDGRRFLVREKKDYNLPPVTEVNLIRNWFEELKRLSPAGK